MPGIVPKGAIIWFAAAVMCAFRVAVSAGQTGPPKVPQTRIGPADPVGLDRRGPRGFPRRLGKGAVHEDEPAGVDQPEHDEQEHGEHEGEFDHALTVRLPPTAIPPSVGHGTTTCFVTGAGWHVPFATVRVTSKVPAAP